MRGDRPSRAALSRLKASRTAGPSRESGTGDRMKLSRRIVGGRELVDPPFNGLRVWCKGVHDQVPWSVISSVVKVRAWVLNGAEICAQYPPFAVRRSCSTRRP